MTTENGRAATKRWALAHPEKTRQYLVTYRARHRDEIRARARLRYQATREQRQAASLAYYYANREKVAAQKRLHKYGLTQEMFDEYLDAQEGACAFCGNELPKALNTISIDHDHETGAYRGLLHRHCNSLLGHAENNDTFVGYIANSNLKEAV